MSKVFYGRPKERKRASAKSYFSIVAAGIVKWTIVLSPLIVPFLLCVPARSLNAHLAITQWNHTSWGTKDGAPTELHALAQTKDGYLWLGSATGLYRFDGLHFDRYEPPLGQALPRSNIAALLSAPDGTLWIGYWLGGISSLKNGVLTSYNENDGLPVNGVRAFAVDAQGTVWAAATRGGLMRFRSGKWARVGAESGYLPTRSDTVFLGSDGTLWAPGSGMLAYLRPGKDKFENTADHVTFIGQLAVSKIGTLWMAETERAVTPVPLNWTAPKAKAPALIIGSQSILFDRTGSLWVGSLGDGLRRLADPDSLHSVVLKSRKDTQPFTESNGLTGNFVLCILEDREGNIWVGTTKGLDRFRVSPIIPVPLASAPVYTLTAGITNSVLTTGGNGLLVSTQQDGASHAGRTLYVSHTFLDSRNNLWIATTKEILKIKDEHVTHLHYPLGLAGKISLESYISAIAEDELGRLWISVVGKGVYRIDEGGATNLASYGAPEADANAAFSSASGKLWFGFDDGSALALSQDKAARYSANEGLTVGRVLSVAGGDEHIWVGGELGLAYFDKGRFRSITSLDGLPFQHVSGVVAPNNDGVWFAEDRGIAHICQVELNRLQATGSNNVDVRLFDYFDGLRSPLLRTRVLPSVVLANDGRLWFATVEGLAWLDPLHQKKNTIVPTVSIDSVSSNGRVYAPLGVLWLPAGTKNIKVAYGAASLSVPERVHFKYRLRGLEKEWQDAVTRREAFYTNLPPGTYQFQVIASNDDGVWNTTGAELSLNIKPSWFQTWWFRGLCAFAAIALSVVLYRLRLRAVTEQIQQRLLERIDERERIARDLHDTLLQSFQGLLLRLHRTQKLIPDRPGDALQDLDEALRGGAMAISEGRDAIFNLRCVASSVDLEDDIRAVADDLFLSNGRNTDHFNLVVEGSTRLLQLEVRRELVRIAREALRNALAHARAHTVTVSIHFDTRTCTVLIKDDGIGIDADVLNAGERLGHLGLISMRERARKIGARFEIDSTATSGTTLIVSIPANLAYKATPDIERS